MLVDWTNEKSVVAYAQKLGVGMTVVKHDNRPNYNITHTSRRDIWDAPGVTVIVHT